MNRREAIAAACASLALPRAAVGHVSGPRSYSVEHGDHGRVWLDGKEVKAVACCPGDDKDGSGWAECMVDESGKPLGVDGHFVIAGNQVAKSLFQGCVRFETEP